MKQVGSTKAESGRQSIIGGRDNSRNKKTAKMVTFLLPSELDSF